jgi:hypothetical protein
MVIMAERLGMCVRANGDGEEGEATGDGGQVDGRLIIVQSGPGMALWPWDRARPRRGAKLGRRGRGSRCVWFVAVAGRLERSRHTGL